MKWNICTAFFKGGKKVKFRVQANDIRGLEATAAAMVISMTNRIPEKVEITECPVQTGY